MSSDEAQSGKPRAGVDGWDRVGDLMGRVNETGQVIARRHMEVWNEISAGLRKDQFSADDWANMNRLVAGSMLDDMQTMVGFWGGTSDRQTAVGGLPLVFLFVLLDAKGGVQTTTPDPKQLIAPRSVTPLPDRARIALSGGPSADAAKAMRDAITVKAVDKDKRTYELVFQAPKKDDLEAGGYTGLIYLRTDQAETALADLRVVVRSREDD